MKNYYLTYKYSSILILIISIGVFLWANYKSVFIEWKYNSSQVLFVTSYFLFGGVMVYLLFIRYKKFFDWQMKMFNHNSTLIDEMIAPDIRKVRKPKFNYLEVIHLLTGLSCWLFLVYMCVEFDLFKNRDFAFFLVRDVTIILYTIVWSVQIIHSAYLIKLTSTNVIRK